MKRTRPEFRVRDMPEYTVYQAMRRRCFSPRDPGYANYGGRSITICERWRASFWNFYDDMGPRPSPKHSIDRVNNDGHYEPANCRWATWSEQMKNRRPFHKRGVEAQFARVVTIDGVADTLTGWASRLGIDRRTISGRMRAGWTAEKAVTTPRRGPGGRAVMVMQ